MSKRQKFILSSALLSLGLLAIQFIDISWRYWAIGSLSVVSILLTLWSLYEALAGIRWLTTCLLPTLLTAAIGLFYFLIPSTWSSQLPVAVAFGIGMYALLLTENIFSVAAIRTIQLFRAASAVGFLLTLLTAFFLYDTIFSFRLTFWLNSLAVFFVSLPLLFHGFWSVNLEEEINKKLVLPSCFLALCLAEFAFVISFMPLTVATSSLSLTTFMYVILGLTQASLAERLFKQTMYEYLSVGLVVLLILVLTARWGG